MRIVTQETDYSLSSRGRNHPHANDTDQSAGSCRWSCEYSLIVLWPHADECHRTAEGERETEVTELALKSDFRQEQWETGGEDILSCLLLSRLVALRCTMGKSKVTEVPVYSGEDAVYSSACGGFSQILQDICYRTANTS